ncbi:1-acyl-sn-glycerol-3-phosphate acyltransferase [Nocardioides sp. zg-1228]|uniref:lysophospholipid acyltransferase family protein n=1 Tax=Nocardioides sp. zg-1228 TaxID=2763008 RepID=UPI0016423BAC|nr:lysophospholipid acyltransferase family protein [Nocardioides sp. zg-1228]MBC2931791.1 1-acyl-sn-glycerol-3-phosphate acyltransferase [Nocardioides sp. zg-1228]QSF57368.1 1-acyl-sn-glycerol-3-phosphate acyltransferase [Nocardioides sp. zg-1228]
MDPSTWQRPGLRAALLYAVAAGLLGAIVSVVSRLELTRRALPDTRLPDGPLIVVANHTSFADGILLALVGRRHGRSLRLMATGGVFRSGLVGPFVRRLGFIPVLRGTDAAAGSLDAAALALAAGEAVGLFPEGRISRDPQHWPERSKTGAVRLALRTGAPIVPVALVGAHQVVGTSGVVRRLLRNTVLRPRVRVAVGEPIDVRRLAGVADGPIADEATVRWLADEVMATLVAQVAELRGEPAPHPTGVPAEALSA